MSNYTKTTDFAAKDALLTGNPLKLIKGNEIGVEFDAIAVAVATKQDSSSSATATQVQNSTLITLTSVSGADTITATAPSPFTAYSDGQEFSFIAASANTGAVTLNINTVGAIAIKKSGGTALDAGDIPAGGFVKVKYKSSGTTFEMMGGAGGGGAKADGCIYENNLTISNNYTLTTGKNGMSVGPITVATGKLVTIPSGQRWLIL